MRLFPPNYKHVPGWKISFDSQEEATEAMAVLRKLIYEESEREREFLSRLVRSGIRNPGKKEN